LPHLWGYLWCNWYHKKHWDRFARASYLHALPLAQTTMIVEAHWRVLKYDYKYTYNQPRLDQLTQIIGQLVNDQINLWQRYCNNREFPAWWHTFKRDWLLAKEKHVDDECEYQYHTDVNLWVCSCLAYLKHPYMLCKHLVAKKNRLTPGFAPHYLNVMRRHDHPFISFNQENTSRIEPENTAWHNSQEGGSRSEYAHRSEIESSEVSGRLESTSIDRSLIIEERREMLENVRRLLNRGVDLAEENIQNDRFYETFKNLVKPITEEITACNEALNARIQQRTWQPPRNRKLPFFLN